MALKHFSNLLIVLFTSFLLVSCETKENDLFGSISGIVTDAETNEPIQGVTVTLVPIGKSTVTGDDGIYLFSKIEAEEYTLQFKSNGYQTNTKSIIVEPYSTTKGDIQLSQGDGNLKVNKSTVEFGTSYNISSLVLSNTGKSSFDWEIKYSCEWIKSITPRTGTIKAGSNMSVTIEIDRDKLSGTNTQKTNITVSTTGGGGLDIQVSVNGSSSGGNSTILTNGLVGFYNFDNDNAYDASGSDINGILINSPEFITDTPNGEGKAIHLRATNGQYLSIPRNPLATSSEAVKVSDFSICFWIKDFGLGQIFSSMNKGTYSAFPYLYFKDDAFHMKISTSGSGYYTYVISFEKGVSQFQNGQWHHVAYVTTNNLHTLYIDGQYFGGTNPSAVVLQYLRMDPFHFGGNCETSDRTATNMKLDNIRFYNRALSTSDVRVIYDYEKN